MLMSSNVVGDSLVGKTQDELTSSDKRAIEFRIAAVNDSGHITQLTTNAEFRTFSNLFEAAKSVTGAKGASCHSIEEGEAVNLTY